jgi:hypothetical protein
LFLECVNLQEKTFAVFFSVVLFLRLSVRLTFLFVFETFFAAQKTYLDLLLFKVVNVKRYFNGLFPTSIVVKYDDHSFNVFES